MSEPFTTSFGLTPEQEQRLERDYVYHAPKGDQPARYQVLRNKGKELATLIMTLTPMSREQSVSLTQLDLCLMQANAAIARNE